MAELAYTTREDCGQHGTGTAAQSARIRGRLGGLPFPFATTDAKRYESDHGADEEFVGFVAPDADDRQMFDLAELQGLQRSDDKLDRHPTSRPTAGLTAEQLFLCDQGSGRSASRGRSPSAAVLARAERRAPSFVVSGVIVFGAGAVPTSRRCRPDPVARALDDDLAGEPTHSSKVALS